MKLGKTQLEPVPPCNHQGYSVRIETSNWFDGGIDKQTGKTWEYRWIYTVCQNCDEQIGPAEYEERKEQ